MSIKSISDWEETLLQEIDRLGTIFTTQTQFDQVIHEILGHPECPLAALQYAIECPPPFSNFTVGSQINRPADGTRKLHPSDNRSTACRVNQWWKSGAPRKEHQLDLWLERLFESYWKSALRTESAGMPDLKREADARVLADRTVGLQIEKRSPCSMLFCDLDNFKPIDDLSHGEGDRIIKEFGALLESISRDQAICLHKGGDEFILLLPGGSAEDAVMLAYQVHRAVTSYDFKAQPMSPGMSIGLASVGVGANAFDELTEQADRALTENAKKPKKGLARFPTEYKVAESGEPINVRLDLAHCLIKSQIVDSSPFANVWLNCVSRIVTGAIAQIGFSLIRVKKSADDFIRWAGLNPAPLDRSRSAYSHEKGLDADPAVCVVDYGFAIAHGILRAALTLNATDVTTVRLLLKYDAEAENCAVCLSDGDILWMRASPNNLSNEYEVGPLWARAPECETLPPLTSRAILIQIGHDEPRIPLSLFAERIVVDDRPTRGGGLPDFWEATIARLVAQVNWNPNIAVIYLLGKHEHGSQTVAKLSDVDSWLGEDEQIAYKTGMPTQAVRKAAGLLKDKVRFPGDEVELLTNLSSVLRAAHTVQPISEIGIAQRVSRFLRRELQMDDMSLGREDGCRVKTIEEAFPVVLEIVRKASEEVSIRDQAGQELRELMDFRVHLTDPNQDLVPAFYRKEEDSLNKYFQKEFLSESGLFGRSFRDTGQLEAVLIHVVSAITSSRLQFATRRAILVVPHKIENGRDLAPLGLISVRCVLRFVQSRAQLHYSYTWRTVEALVGFPYSLYGSVRFGQYLTEQIKDRLPNEYTKQVEMGQVSYIAHSLHMFMDDYGQNIARRIVDDASF